MTTDPKTHADLLLWRRINRRSLLSAAIAFGVSFAVYVLTAAPNVTLLDSGEFLVAAQHFGVPHPTGYPPWTLLAWLFQWLPLGNVAWELAVFSGFCGALAVGMTAAMIHESARWLLADFERHHPVSTSACAVGGSLLFAFSLSMWSQATIVEVYTLHALLVAIFLSVLLYWSRHPGVMPALYASFFTLSLAFANHHLALALAPLPLVIILCLRRDLLWDVATAIIVSILIGYLSFALLADDPLVLRAAVRMTGVALLFIAIALIARKGRLKWRMVVLLPASILLGLLPYIYLPLASSTNPPMNWGYTRTAEGFFASFNRSQYPGSLSDQSLRVLALVLGLSELAPAESSHDAANPEPEGSKPQVQSWPMFFAERLLDSFSPVAVLLVIAAAALGIRGPPEGRTWILCLLLGFIFSALLQPTLDRARTDLAGWWLQMPFHASTNLFVGILNGIGATAVCGAIARLRKPALRPAVPALAILVAVLPAWPLIRNHPVASQRNRWFGWEYGYEMLRDLPEGSVLLGGTDPGRFIPTYMIFGESVQAPELKRDPAFDRRDIYILTQNALADRYYLNYVRDHYTSMRESATSRLLPEWLVQRESLYPEKPLVLPTLAQMQQITAEALAESKQEHPNEPRRSQEDVQAAVVKWIFDRNKANHRFFVEESYPLRWSYRHAIPRGLVYEISREPVPVLSPATISQDFNFWDAQVNRLLPNPLYRTDLDAQRAYSRLRLTGSRIYEYRGLWSEAERAAEQALALWPANPDAARTLTRLLWRRGEYEEPIGLFECVVSLDPNNPQLWEQLETARARSTRQIEINEAEAAFDPATSSLATVERLVHLHESVGNSHRLAQIISSVAPRFTQDPRFLQLAADTAFNAGDFTSTVVFAERMIALELANPNHRLTLARAQILLGNLSDAKANIQIAIELGGLPTRETVLQDPILSQGGL